MMHVALQIALAFLGANIALWMFVLALSDLEPPAVRSRDELRARRAMIEDADRQLL